MGAVTAALITGREAVEYREFDEMPPSAGCVTIDIRLCGICGTDIASYRSGHLHSPAVCGHEWVGTIRRHRPRGVRNFDRGRSRCRGGSPSLRTLPRVPSRDCRVLPIGVRHRPRPGCAGAATWRLCSKYHGGGGSCHPRPPGSQR